MSTCCIYRVPSIFLLLQSGLESSENIFNFGEAHSTVLLDYLLGDTESTGFCKVETHHTIN